ncbi:hypothetical protein [Cellulomonas chengniuliangii]|uniref:ESX-1 secretion-associated protein n=1 Tax=Cellulomonas chengniuliangii TaxID=2968084 RepID=A0ABY5L158_9CELL|nr:hypothetical protein [Cellulomonas chengniuliangii]MCC2309224.1 hypothetical protein [Cellulomonas chengniuliangii]MCC2318568.1 hypothetical protein [Cellulomonas chengniuliangii]UUI75201.1 hypothetical protein NP064_15760 [Cellulomonas chengniuliangii]
MTRGSTLNGAMAVSPVVAMAMGHIEEAARSITAAGGVTWVSDAATRYRAALDEAQQAVARTARDVAAAHTALVLHDRATAAACADMRVLAGRSLLDRVIGRP